MKNRNQNIIIGVMIVALTLIIIGTTYAYFTGSGSTVESTSTIFAKGGILEIKYANNEGSGSIELFDIYPREEEWVSKTFTITGKNNTDLQMKYEIGLKTDNNTFTSGSLSYSLISENTSNNGEVVASINSSSITSYSHTFGTGYFEAGENLVHTYTLKIYFKDTGQNQNANQGAKYAGHITIKDSAFNKIALSKSNLSAIGYTDNEVPSNLVIPQTYMIGNDINQVTSIADNAFHTGDYSQGTLAPIPSLLNLTSLTLNEGLEEIGDYSFAAAMNLKQTITMPSTLKTIGTGSFAQSGITGVVFNSGLESIGYGAFYQAASLTGNINIPGSVKLIDGGAFEGTAITGLTLNEGLETIGNGAFLDITTLTGNIVLPNTLKTIDTNAFYNTSITGNLTIPNTVKTIGKRAFANTDITGLTLNEGLEEIGGYSFVGISFNQTITMPSTVKIIGEYAFENSDLTDIILNEGLETIGDGAFSGTSISNGTITIPSTVKSIGFSAFYESNVTRINYRGTEEQWKQISKGTSAIPMGITIYYNYTGQ